MGTIIIVLVLAVICIAAVISYIKKLKSGCCGKDMSDIKKPVISDNDKSHYPYCVKIKISGMSCDHCRESAENSLNSLDGVLAEVSLKTNTATVYMKEKFSDDKLKAVISEAGYSADEITSCE